MRCGPAVILLALLFGAGSALAQSDSIGKPGPVEQIAPTAKKQRAVHTHKTAARLQPKAPAVNPAPAPKPDIAKSATAKVEPAKQDHAKVETAPSPELAAIPPDERLKIQSALYWSGDYANVGAGSNALEAAIINFQKRNKSKLTGMLTSEQRAELVAAADNHEQEFGWSVVVDPATGIRIGLPTKLVPNAREAANGTRWSSPHGEVQVETFRVKNTTLAALFEQERKGPETRQIEHSALNDDNFIISGMQGLKLFTVRAKLRDGEIRGFTLLYDQMMEGIVAPVMVAMASAFSPFPENAAPFAALAKKVEYGTGLIVSADGYILTARRVAQGCQVIVADGIGNAERVAEDTSGLALLRVYGARKLPALPLIREAATGGDITLIGIPDPKEQDGAKKLTEIKAKLANSTAITLSQPVPVAGFAGAAALDAKGQFLGIMETRNFTLASAEPTLPPVRLINAATIRDFLAAQKVPLAQAANADARKAAIRVICVRK